MDRCLSSTTNQVQCFEGIAIFLPEMVKVLMLAGSGQDVNFLVHGRRMVMPGFKSSCLATTRSSSFSCILHSKTHLWGSQSSLECICSQPACCGVGREMLKPHSQAPPSFSTLDTKWGSLVKLITMGEALIERMCNLVGSTCYVTRMISFTRLPHFFVCNIEKLGAWVRG